MHLQETSTAHYIIQQYLAATGCSSKFKQQQKIPKNMYIAGMVKMICCQTEISSGNGGVKTLGTRSGERGCFVLWQMSPGMWSLELVVGGNKVLAGSDAKIVWRHTPWLGTHAAKGPQRPLRRIIQVRTSLHHSLLHVYRSRYHIIQALVNLIHLISGIFFNGFPPMIAFSKDT